MAPTQQLRVVLSIAILLCVFTPVSAQQSLGKFNAKLEKLPAKDSEPTAHKLTLTGLFQDVPEGTEININFRMQGTKQFIPYSITLDKTGRFKLEKTYTKEMFPANYEVEYMFVIANQSPPVKKWFRVNMGWSSTHVEILKVVKVTVGDKASQNQASRELYTQLEKFRSRAAEVFDTVKTQIVARQRPDKAQYEKLYKTLLKVQSEYEQWAMNYVALPAGKIRNRLFGTINQLFTILEEHAGGVDWVILDDYVKTYTAAFTELKTSLELKPIKVKKPEGKK